MLLKPKELSVTGVLILAFFMFQHHGQVLKPVLTSHLAVLSWRTPSTGPAPDSYVVYRGDKTCQDGPTSSFPLSTSDTTYQDRTVVAGHHYTYWVSSRIGSKESAKSNCVSVTIPTS